jgi:hypothetical protein
MGLLQEFWEVVHTAKDAGVSFLVQRAVAQWLQPYGRMLNLSIDSKNSRIHIELMPKGESQSVTLEIEEYQLTSAAGAEFIVIKKASASREWIDALIQDFVIGRPLPLPEKYRQMVKTVL